MIVCKILFTWSSVKFCCVVKDYLDISHLTKLKYYIYITEIYMKKQYKSSINQKIKKKKYGVPLKVFIAS